MKTVIESVERETRQLLDRAFYRPRYQPFNTYTYRQHFEDWEEEAFGPAVTLLGDKLADEGRG